MSRVLVGASDRHGVDDESARDQFEESPLAPVVDVMMDRRTSMQRRSSTSIALTAPMETVASLATTMTAGDQAARPHFLKDRSVTMRPDFGLSSSLQGPSSRQNQSKAGSFLAKIVERSRTIPSTYDGKNGPSALAFTQQSSTLATPPSTAMVSASVITSDDTAASPQRRRQSVVIKFAHVNSLNHLQHQYTMPALLPRARPTLHSISSGMNSLTTHDEDEPNEYVTEVELQDRALSQLVRDLSLYKMRSGTLLRILTEIQRRLNDAEIESSTQRPCHVAMCRELVDDGVLSGLVLVLREFRFHVSLQAAAVSLLSFIADVSDLYAYMMAALDVEPLVQKILAVHVSQERLVMNGSSLIHKISECKHKPQVVKMHKARQLEREKKRAASFVEAFTAERKHSKFRALEASGGRGCSAVSRDEFSHKLHSASRWQRSALSKKLGVPPLLTAHYDLEVSLFTPPSTVIPSLQRALCESNAAVDDRPHSIRPKTSPDPRQLIGQSSAAKLAAVYLTSPTFCAPSPLGKRIQATRKTQSAILSNRNVARIGCSNSALRVRTDTRGSLGISFKDHEEVESVGDVSLDAHSYDVQSDEQVSREDKDGAYTDEDRTAGRDPLEEESSYDDDDFDHEDSEDRNYGVGDEAAAIQDRLLPVGSDSDLFELVSRSESEDKTDCESRQSALPLHGDIDREPLPSSTVASPLITDTSTGDDLSTTPRDVRISDMVTTELIDLLSSCVHPEDPTILSTPGQNSSWGSEASARTRPRKKTPEPSPPSPVALVSSTDTVRPVSRRILDKTAKTSRRRNNAAVRSPEHQMEAINAKKSREVLNTAQIATLLDKVRCPANADPAGEDEPVRPATAFGTVCSSPPSTTPTTSVAHIQALYARGLQHHKANELDAAVRCYEQGIHLQHSSGVEREFASLYINLGSARMAQQRPYDALVAFTQAQRIQPLNMKAMFNAGLVLMQLAQWEDAIAKFDQVVAADPSHVRAHCALDQCKKSMTLVHTTSTGHS